MGSSPLTRGKRRFGLRGGGAGGLIPAHAGKTAYSRRGEHPKGAHPRSRGENGVIEAEGQLRQGSSPLTRGKHVVAGLRSRLDRLIPAHAGKTAGGAVVHARAVAHPRSRGENTSTQNGRNRILGSSPLTRGKLPHRTQEVQAAGLIPAHAGKTVGARGSAVSVAAHPRSRGENGAAHTRLSRQPGSSPLTRGKLLDAAQEVSELGLIPAHAGKTHSGAGRRWVPRAHPRSRGENPYGNSPPPVNLGSSPLTRGKPTTPRPCIRSRGLIPAHAGKTQREGRSYATPKAHPRSRGENARRRPFRRYRRRLIPAHAGKTHIRPCVAFRSVAHPRSRGENVSVALRTGLRPGSSPLTRGKPGREHHQPEPTGLIPAHAGKTTGRNVGPCVRGAHPRSRGENGTHPYSMSSPQGSSPLTRGKRGVVAALAGGGGLIPAHAGKTLPDLRFYRADRSDLGKP